MNLRDLEYLVAVAEHRHFGRAADACFVSQPTLSTQIRKLEAELGVELFERTSRRVLLTDVGERIVARARTLLHDADDIRELARQATDPESGSIRLGIFPTLAPYLLPHVVVGLHHAFPRLEVLLVEEKTPVVIDQLVRGDLDAGILALPFDAASLVTTELFTEEFVLAVPADHRLAASAGAVDLSVLSGERVLLLEDGHCLRDQALSVCHTAGAEERHGFRATSLETLRQMVAAGVGITLLPMLSVSAPVPPQPQIVLRRFTRPAPGRRIALCWRPTSVYADVLVRLASSMQTLLAAGGGGRGGPAPSSRAPGADAG